MSYGPLCANLTKTRMHSSRMRTGRSLTVCRSLVSGGCVSARGGGVVCSQGGCLLLGGCLLGGGCGIPACTEADNPPPREQNDKQVQKYYLGHNFVADGNKAQKEVS